MIYSTVWVVVKPLMTLMIRIFGREHISKYPEPLIIVANHVSYMDIPAIACLFPPTRPVHFFAKKELFQNSFFGFIFRYGNAIPVDRENSHAQMNKDAIRTARAVLRGKGIVGIFMQGGIRNSVATGEEVKRSPILLARRARVPEDQKIFLPIRLTIRKKWFSIPDITDIGPMTLVCGCPVSLKDLAASAGSERSHDLADALFQHIVNLENAI